LTNAAGYSKTNSGNLLTTVGFVSGEVTVAYAALYSLGQEQVDTVPIPLLYH
jgi:hypothetical protein